MTNIKIPYYKGFMGSEELEEISSVLHTGWLTTGKVTTKFENSFADLCSTKHALATNSCTAALHLALEALGIGPEDKVVVPTLTFTATAEVIRYLGAHPVFVDVDPETCLLNADSLLEEIGKHENIKACIAVHFGGQSVEMVGRNGIWDICQQYGIRLIVDAAHSFPAADVYGPVGCIGDATCFSFYANKTITTGEGGMLVTNSDRIADRVRVMRLHGINRDVWDRFTSDQPSWEYDVVAPGFKYNMPDINAAIGIVQLKKAEYMRRERQKIAQRYYEACADQNKYVPLRCRVKYDDHAWHLFPVVLQGKYAAYRSKVIEELAAKGISTSVHYKPLHRMTYYKEKYRLRSEDFPNAEYYWKGCISLPIFSGMTAEEVGYVCETLAEVVISVSI